MKGLRVGALYGYDLESDIAVPVKYKEVSSLRSLLKMLNKGRLEAVLGYKEEMITEEKKFTDQDKAYVIKTHLLAKLSFPVFSNSTSGKKLMQAFDQGMVKMHESGRLKCMSQAG